MLELSTVKKGWGNNVDDNNMRSRSKSRERVSLLGNSRSNGQGQTGLRGRDTRRRTRGEEPLLGRPSPGKLKKRDYRRTKRDGKNKANVRWTYAAMFVLGAFLSFKLFQKETKMIHWEEYNNILEPNVLKSKRCSESSLEHPCVCPDPAKALENKDNGRWKSNHEHMVHQAKSAPRDLDIVFFGDGMVEQLSGSRELGKPVDGMVNYFEKTFSKKKGGKFNAIALGSSGDSGPNLLWHWENGIQQANLRPKLWFLIVGGNDLYVNKCNDDFVKASVLNVAKKIFQDQPDAKIVVHGIIPRKDDLDSKTKDLGHLWNRAQGINLNVRKFIKGHSSRIYYMNLGQVLMATSGMKGRGVVDPHLIEGIYPTGKGMVKWGNMAVKKIAPILKGFDLKMHMEQTMRPELINENNKNRTAAKFKKEGN